MRLRTKLLLGFLTSPVFFFAHSLSSYISLSSIRDDVLSLQRFIQTSDLLSQSAAEIASITHPEEIVSSLIRSRSQSLEKAGILGLLSDRLERTRIHLRSLESLAREAASKAALQRALDALEDYRSKSLGLAAAIQRRGADGARGPERELAMLSFGRLSKLGGAFNHSIGEESRRAVANIATRLGHHASTLAGRSLSFVLVLTVVIAYALAGLSARDILRLHRAARRVEGGDLAVTLEVRAQDEIGELTSAFNDMTRRLREVYSSLEDTVRERTEALRERESSLQKSQKLAALGRLSAGVAHDLGGPLAIIATAAEGLRERAQSPALASCEDFVDFPDYLEMIESEAYRLKKVIRRLLDFARPSVLALEPLDLAVVVASAVELARLDQRSRSVKIEVERDTRQSLVIHGDEDRLHEVTLNLIFNALDAIDTSGEVRLSLERHDHEATLKISDNGAGIAAEHLSQIFEPFFTTKRDGAGTGLGLALAVSCVEAHGGTIMAHSGGAGRGACFELSFPLRAKLKPS
jgi:signal transduction histidine kinase